MARGVWVRVFAPAKLSSAGVGPVGGASKPQLQLNAENTLFAADYTLYNCVYDK